jgi:hypothetical protein
MIFMFVSSLAISSTCWFLGLRIARNRIRKGKGDMPGFLVAFGGIILGVIGPLLVLRLFVFPYIAQYNTFAAEEIRVEENNGEIVQFIVYEDGTELNLTEKTGKYYTELPDSEMNQETCTFLWVVEWDQKSFTGLDFLPRN